MQQLLIKRKGLTEEKKASLTVDPHLEVASDPAHQVWRGSFQPSLSLMCSHLQQQQLVQHDLP